MKIVLFCGSFNPLHMGHLFIAMDAYTKTSADLVFFVPSKQPVNKPQLLESAHHRFQMTKCAISDIPFFKISDFEMKQEGISYSYKTIQYFKETYSLSKEELFFIIGSDWLNSLEKWMNYEFILKNSTFIVINRIINDLSGQKFDSDTYDYLYLDKRYDISSTLIRGSIAENRYYKIYLPEAVYDYIQINGLYG